VLRRAGGPAEETHRATGGRDLASDSAAIGGSAPAYNRSSTSSGAFSCDRSLFGGDACGCNRDPVGGDTSGRSRIGLAACGCVLIGRRGFARDIGDATGSGVE
jgi:hypothetical protein